MLKEKITYRNLIQYLKGKLSNKERYMVEKEILEDPFLQDALEGFETIDINTLESDITLLNQQIEQQSNIIKSSSFYVYSIAASVLVLIGLSFWWFSNRKSIVDTQIVYEDAKEEILYKELDSILNTPTEIVFSAVEKEIPTPSIAVSKSKHIQKEIEEKEEVVLEEIEANIKEITEEEVAFEQATEVVVVDIEKPVIRSSSPVIEASDASLKKSYEPNIATTTTSLTNTEAFSRRSKIIDKGLEEVRVTGKVTAVGKPLADVAVIVKGEMDKITETDSNGNYSMITTKGSTLSFFFIGYERKEILVENSLTIDVELTEEVVEALLQAGQVTYNTEGRESLEQIDAIPFNHTLEAFKKWVKIELKSQYPDILLRKNVTLQIDINENGIITQVILLSNLSKQTQKALKKVVKSSPDWTPAQTTGEEDIPSRVILTIGFGA